MKIRLYIRKIIMSFVIISMLFIQTNVYAISSISPTANSSRSDSSSYELSANEDKYTIADWNKKIKSDLYEKAQKKNDKYLVYIFRNSIPESVINEEITSKTGYNASIYRRDKFRSVAIPLIKEQVQNRTAKLHISPQELQETISRELENYNNARLSIAKDLYSAHNQSFINKNVKNPEDVYYCGTYTSTIIVYATKDEIEAYAKISNVLSIEPYEDTFAVPETNLIHNQVAADRTTGTKSALFNSNSGYLGDGVKIGVLEVAGNGIGGRCDVSSPQLAPIVNTRLFVLDTIRADGTTVPVSVTDHATLVTSIIVGQSATLNETVYEGIVPNATVYQMPFASQNDLLIAINHLVSLGVKIINMSAGFPNDGNYNSIDKDIDQLVYSYQICFIKSAGNNSNNVSSPGKAYNVITVGNAKTKGSDSSVLSDPYNMCFSPLSSYEENSYLTEKPDVVAPGYKISCVKNSTSLITASGTSLITASGTSCSAPIVTGIVAQLQQEFPVLRYDCTATKALIAAGCDFDAITETNNPSIVGAPFHRERSGAGLVNAVNSMTILTESNLEIIYMDLSSDDVNDIYDIPVYLEAGETIRVSVVNDKPEDIPLTSAYQNDVALFLFESDYTTLDVVVTDNNIETIEYTATESGEYIITVFMNTYISASTYTLLDITVAWQIK